MSLRGALITCVWIIGGVWWWETGLRATTALIVAGVAVAMAIVTREYR
jgi:hypothetical protein